MLDTNDTQSGLNAKIFIYCTFDFRGKISKEATRFVTMWNKISVQQNFSCK
jgi:hypothetical protein